LSLGSDHHPRPERHLSASTRACHRLTRGIGSELDRYLIELPDQATWIEGTRYLLTDYESGSGRPWPHYRGEDQVWI
jgi:hypothetical protein